MNIYCEKFYGHGDSDVWCANRERMQVILSIVRRHDTTESNALLMLYRSTVDKPINIGDDTFTWVESINSDKMN